MRATDADVDKLGHSAAQPLAVPPTFQIAPFVGTLPEELLELAHSGGLVAFPTETFYALGCRIDRPEGLEAIAELKGRGPNHPFPLVADSLRTVHRLCEFPRRLATLAAGFWPGPLTLAVQPRTPQHALVTAPDGTVGIRISSLPLARGIAEAAGGVLCATSANLVGEAPACAVPKIDPALHRGLDAVVDGGHTAGGPPSSIVRLDDDGELRIIRAGALSERRLREAWGAIPWS